MRRIVLTYIFLSVIGIWGAMAQNTLNPMNNRDRFGNQIDPNTLVGMKTSTSPYGRDVHLHGYPLKMADIAAQLEGTAYVTRQSVQSVPAIRKAKKAIRKAFENSMAGKGSNLVEIVSTCNSGWKMSPAKSNEWMVENMFPFYPLGDLKDK